MEQARCQGPLKSLKSGHITEAEQHSRKISKMPRGISELEESLQRPLHHQTLPSHCSVGSTAGRRLPGHFATRRRGRAMGSSGCWRSVALQLNEVLLRHPSAQDHGGTRPWDLHRKTLLHRVFISAIWLSWSPLSFACFASPHSTTLLNTRNSTCYPLCVYILSQEDWDFTGGCFCGQRQKLRSTSVGMGAYSRRLQRVLLGHARTLPLKSNGTLILFLLATTIGMAWHLSTRFTEGKATHRWARRRECCYRPCSVYGSSFPYTIQSYSHCKDRC